MRLIKDLDLRVSAMMFSESPTRRFVTASRAGAQKTIFLSHSSQDMELVYGLVDKISKLGFTVYIDKNDSGLPRVTDRETARILKNKIIENDYFIALITDAAIVSKWIPWEIGLADQIKKDFPNKLLIVPVTDNYGSFIGNEYLRLYNSIQIDELSKELLVNMITGAVKLAQYIR